MALWQYGDCDIDVIISITVTVFFFIFLFSEGKRKEGRGGEGKGGCWHALGGRAHSHCNIFVPSLIGVGGSCYVSRAWCWAACWPMPTKCPFPLSHSSTPLGWGKSAALIVHPPCSHGNNCTRQQDWVLTSYLGLNPGSATFYMCDLKQVIESLSIPCVFSPERWEW